MIGRRTAVGLALLCTLMFSALAAQGAVAQVGTKSTNTTAVTCVEVKSGTGRFEDSHCDKLHPTHQGEYEHEAIAKDTTTELEVTTEKTKNNTTEDTPSKLNAVLAGVNTEIICTSAKRVAGKSFIHNVETEGKHTVTGTVQITLSGCEVLKPKNCIVTDIVLTAEIVGVEGLKPGGNDMGLEFVGEGADKTLTELVFHKKDVLPCSIENMTKPYKLKGSAIATSNVAQGNAHSGATAVFTPLPKNPASAAEREEGMQTLEIGLKQADFTGTFTTTMASGGNPIALTTAT